MISPVSPSTEAAPRLFTIPGANTAMVDAAIAATKPLARVGFDISTTLRGSTNLFKVYYDSSMGVKGLTLADAVLAFCDRDYQTIRGFFGGVTPSGLPFNVIVGQGFGGAYHYGC